MSTDGPTDGRANVAGHVHGDRCAVCGSATDVERKYPLTDRLARGLFVAICRAEGLEPYVRSKGATAPVYVTAPDVATHERLWARYGMLMPKLDDRLLVTTSDFIREHCGLDMPPEPRG
jgi:hypothetical protein